MTKFYSALLGLLIVAICSCERSGPKEEDQIIITVDTDEPLNYMKHWHHADSGILARFGAGSEVGAMLQYDFESDRKFVFFDQTGKRFLFDEFGSLHGPFEVKELFNRVDIWGGKGDAEAIKFAKGIDSFGIESAVFVPFLPFGQPATFEVALKNGEVRVLYLTNPAEIKDSDYSMFVHGGIGGALEALMWYNPADDTEYASAIMIDYTGENVKNGNGDVLGSVSSYWPQIPSKKVEAMCYFKDQNTYPTIIRVLGEEGNITNGRYLYITTEDPVNGNSNILTDLKKSY